MAVKKKAIKKGGKNYGRMKVGKAIKKGLVHKIGRKGSVSSKGGKGGGGGEA